MFTHKGSTVLIVEDDEGVATLEQRRLERAGFRSILADSAENALKELRARHVDIILLDYKLPDGIDGLEFYAQLRDYGLDLPVILVTGFGSETLIIKALRVGVRDYITKSMEFLDYLPEAVERVLKQTQMEHRLAESESRLASVIQGAKDAILVAEADQTIALFNPAAEAMFRCSAAEALGQPLHRYFRMELPPDASSSRSLTAQVSSWTRGVRSGGEEFPLEASISRSETSGRVLHTLLVRDISERKRAEAQIREQAALLEEATDAILACDMDNRIVYWNRAAERLYGRAGTEALGQDVRDIFNRSAAAAFALADAALAEKGEWKGELRQTARGGREIVVDSRWTLMHDEAKKPRAKLIINTDVTERKKLEAQLLRSQRLESLGTLAGGIAHDLNNMLTPVMMSLELLRVKVTEPDCQLLLSTLQTSTERGADLVRQILAFARGTPGQRHLLSPTPLLIDLAKLVKQIFPKNILVESAAPAGLRNVHADATQIHQVLMNLCLNARDAMPAGGRLTIAAENYSITELNVRLHPEARTGLYVVLTIEDTGAGMTPEIIEKIFDPFFTTKDIGAGTGLGLSTAIGIVRSHQGFITVYSEPGKGSQFKVYLPAMDDGQHRSAPELAPALPMGQGECILLVDDESAILHLGRAILEAHGYQVRTAANGRDALAVFEQQRSDIKLVITDLAMPNFDGRATVRGLRALDARIPIVITSGFIPNGNADPELQDVQGFLAKPYSAETLLTMVHKLLDGNRIRGSGI